MKAATRFFLALFCAAALSEAQTVVRQPYLQSVRSDRASVLWTMLQSGAGAVQFSTDRSFSRTVNASIRDFVPSETGAVFPFYQYKADLTNLSPGTEYFYRLTLNGNVVQTGDNQYFRTPGTGSSAFVFLAFGDSGVNSAQQIGLAARMTSQEDPALVLHVGDIAYPSGTYQEFQANHFDVYRDLMKRVPFFPVAGNHEYWRNGNPRSELTNALAFVNMHAAPADGVPAADRGRYYSFDWGNVHFIALDSNLPLSEAAEGAGQMLQWLENDLQRTRRFWRIAYFHHPPYAGGPNQTDPLSRLARQWIVPILERYNVQLVLNGHEHSYQRSFPLRGGTQVPAGTGTVYVTTGGGGHTNLYPTCCDSAVEVSESVHHYVRGEVQGARLTLRVIRLNGSEGDILTLAPPPVVAEGGVVNAASFTGQLAPGGLFSIFGRTMGIEEAFATRLPLPTELGGINVTMNGRRIPLLYVSGGQINAQLPFDAPASVTLQVNTPNGASQINATVSHTAPGIFTASTERGLIGTVVHTDGSLVTAASPVRPGENVSVFLTGLGDVTGNITAGQAAPSSPLAVSRADVSARIGGAPVAPSYAGLTPGFAGLYQVNLRIPSNLSSGPHTLQIVADGVSSNLVTLDVR